MSQPEVAGSLFGDVADQLVRHVGEDVIDEAVAPGVVVTERECLVEAAALDRDDPLDKRLPGQSVGIE